MNIWTKIKEIFLKSNKKKLDEEFQSTKLRYTGEEPDCWACKIPIHESQFSRRLNGKRMHRTCFKKLKKIAQSGGGLNEF